MPKVTLNPHPASQESTRQPWYAVTKTIDIIVTLHSIVTTHQTCLQVGSQLARAKFDTHSGEDSNLVAITKPSPQLLYLDEKKSLKRIWQHWKFSSDNNVSCYLHSTHKRSFSISTHKFLRCFWTTVWYLRRNSNVPSYRLWFKTNTRDDRRSGSDCLALCTYPPPGLKFSSQSTWLSTKHKTDKTPTWH